jgi:hypothetical protein
MATQDPGVASWTPINIFAMIRALVNNGVPLLTFNGAPVSGTSGTFAGQCVAPALLFDYTDGVVYQNVSTNVLSPTWVVFGSSAGVPGSALSVNQITKETTAIADNTATAIFTVTVPNAAEAASIEVTVLGRLGAGGAIGADEASSTSKYMLDVARTPGVASVCTVGAQVGLATSSVAGGATVTAVVTQTANGEGVTVTNTHTIKITIAHGTGASTNHKCDFTARIINANATGVTIA